MRCWDCLGDFGNKKKIGDSGYSGTWFFINSSSNLPTPHTLISTPHVSWWSPHFFWISPYFMVSWSTCDGKNPPWSSCSNKNNHAFFSNFIDLIAIWWFPEIGGTPSHHPFRTMACSITNHPAFLGYPHVPSWLNLHINFSSCNCRILGCSAPWNSPPELPGGSPEARGSRCRLRGRRPLGALLRDPGLGVKSATGLGGLVKSRGGKRILGIFAH